MTVGLRTDEMCSIRHSSSIAIEAELDSETPSNEAGSYLGFLAKYLSACDVFQSSFKRNLLMLWEFSDSYLLFVAEEN